MGMITLTGYILVPDADIATVEKHMPDHNRLSLEEDGCLEFNLRVDPTNPNRYLVDELFKDRAAFDVHSVRAKASAWGNATAHLERSFEISE